MMDSHGNILQTRPKDETNKIFTYTLELQNCFSNGGCTRNQVGLKEQRGISVNRQINDQRWNCNQGIWDQSRGSHDSNEGSPQGVEQVKGITKHIGWRVYNEGQYVYIEDGI